jgi:hypothetical protein
MTCTIDTPLPTVEDFFTMERLGQGMGLGISIELAMGRLDAEEVDFGELVIYLR